MKRAAAAVGLALLFSSAVTTQQTGLTDAQRKAADLEVPQLVSLLDLKPGMTMADVGAGFGAWTMRFASSIGPKGRVYATDVGGPQLAALREAVQRDKLLNVTVIEGATASTNLPPLCCDAILVRDAYHHFTQPEDMVRSLAAALKPGGRLAIIDFAPRPASEVPAGVPANRGGHGIPADVVRHEAGALLEYVSTIDKWAPDGQPAALYLVLFRKP